MNLSVILIALTISFGRSYLKEIRALIDQGEPQRALQVIQNRLPEERGKRREKLLLLGIEASYNSGDFQGTINYGNQFILEFPESKKVGLVRYYMAKSYLEMGNKDMAAVEFLKAYAGPAPSWVKDSSYVYLFGLIDLGADLFHNLLSRGYLDKRVTPTRKVAVLVPQSGSMASLGKEFMRGFRLALPVSVKLVEIDTRSDTSYASYIAETLKDSVFALVVGPLTSMFAMSTAPKIDSAAILNLIPGAADLRLGDIGNFVIPFNYALKLEVEKLASYALDSLHAKRVYILFPDDAQYISAALYFKQLVEKSGGTVVEAIKVPSEGLPFREELDIIRRISREDYPLIFAPAGNRGIYSMVSQMRFYDVNPIVLGCDRWLSWRRKNELNIVIAAPQPGIPDIDRQEVLDNFMQIFGVRPSSIAETGYDAGAIVARIMQDGPISSISAWQKADSIGIFRGIAGNYVLSRNKDLINLYSFGQIKPAKGGNP